MNRPVLGWAAAPVVIWGALVATGLLAGPLLCRTPLVMAAFFILAVAAMARAVVLSRQERREPAQDLVASVAMKVGLLFTAGTALTWAMVGLGPCL
jgi:hypothetical protein